MKLLIGFNEDPPNVLLRRSMATSLATLLLWRARKGGGLTIYPRLNLGKLRSHSAFGDFGIVSRLSAQPVSIGESKKPAETQISIGGDGALTSDDLCDTLGRHADLFSEPVPANSHWPEELFQEQFTWRYGFKLSHDGSPSVVVHNLNVLRACIGPAETNAPLIIDADAVLSSAFSPERLKVITRWNAEVPKPAGNL
jgi:hypothetical protein